MNRLIFLATTSYLLMMTNATIFTACDCDFATTKGIVDLGTPEYCNSIKTGDVSTTPVNYTLFIKRKPPMRFKGFICEMWIKYKKIVGSFWIGDFDTTYEQKTLHVTSDICWRMINDQKCGMGSEENDMIKSDTTYSFQREPEGEGAWFSTKEYSVINCHAREITLYQEMQGGPIVSPLGELNNDVTSEQFQLNTNIITWHFTDALRQYQTTCDPTAILQGKGDSYASVGEHGKIMDRINQLEFIYDRTNILTLCNGSAPVHKIFGVPDTYISVIPTSLPKPRNKRNVALRSYRVVAQGTIRLFGTEDGFLTSIDTEGQLDLQYEHEPVPDRDPGISYKQKYELGNDYILKISNTDYCVGLQTFDQRKDVNEKPKTVATLCAEKSKKDITRWM